VIEDAAETNKSEQQEGTDWHRKRYLILLNWKGSLRLFDMTADALRGAFPQHNQPSWMDQPLFGERRKEHQVFQWLITFLVVGFCLFSLGVGIAFGLSKKEGGDKRNFALATTVLLAFVQLAILVFWWRDKEDRLHPKFKWLVILNVITVIVACITLNTFAFRPCNTYPCPGGLRSMDDGICYQPAGSLSNCLPTSQPYYYLTVTGTPAEKGKFETGSAYCQFYNTSQIPSFP